MKLTLMIVITFLVGCKNIDTKYFMIAEEIYLSPENHLEIIKENHFFCDSKLFLDEELILPKDYQNIKSNNYILFSCERNKAYIRNKRLYEIVLVYKDTLNNKYISFVFLERQNDSCLSRIHLVNFIKDRNLMH
jgi:hypothetical protein